MNKKLSIFAIVLIIIGLIGSIWSGFFSMPYFINKVQSYDAVVNKQTTVYDEKIDINKLNIDTSYANVEILKSDSENTIIKTCGLEDNYNLEITSNDNTLTVKEEYSSKKSDSIKSIDDLTNKIIEEMFSNHRNIIIIYVPEKIDLEINTDMSSVNIQDDIFLDTFNFTTDSGNISLPSEVKSLKTMNISSNQYLYLQLNELFGIDEVTLNCGGVEIYSENYNLNDVEKYVPNNIIINTDNTCENEISISSSFPICKNLSINGYKSEVRLNLPLDRYKFNFALKAYDNIELNDYMWEIINNMDASDENNESLKELNKIINEDEIEEYKINISSSNIYFE